MYSQFIMHGQRNIKLRNNKSNNLEPATPKMLNGKGKCGMSGKIRSLSLCAKCFKYDYLAGYLLTPNSVAFHSHGFADEWEISVARHSRRHIRIIACFVIFRICRTDGNRCVCTDVGHIHVWSTPIHLEIAIHCTGVLESAYPVTFHYWTHTEIMFNVPEWHCKHLLSVEMIVFRYTVAK